MISDGYLGRPCSDFLSKCIKHLNLDEKIFSAAQVCTNGTRAIFNTIALTKHNRKNGQFRCFDRKLSNMENLKQLLCKYFHF